MKPLRILIAGQIYSDGNGQGGFTLRLAENLVRQGHQVRMIMPSDHTASYSLSRNGVQVEKIAAIHMSIIHPAIYLTVLPDLDVKKIFEDFAPDIVHIQDQYFLCQAVVREARKRRIPLIGTNHFLPENLLPFLIKFPRLRNLVGQFLWKWMLDVFNQLDAVTTPSEAGAEILKQQEIQFPVHAISNGVDAERFFPDLKVDRKAIRSKYNLAHDRILFLYVGRLDGEKCVDVLLEAVSRLNGTNWHLAIIGDGLQAHALQHQAHRLTLEDRVSFLGYVPAEDLPALYNSADMFVMPSPAELQSIATLEAIACGKPILAANARALPELVTHGVNGYLFEPSNASDAARWMKEFIRSPEQWLAMGRESLALSKVHHLSNTIRAYEECYQLVIEKQSGIQKPILFESIKPLEAYRSKKAVKQ